MHRVATFVPAKGQTCRCPCQGSLWPAVGRNKTSG
jgi:hypothetical protein